MKGNTQKWFDGEVLEKLNCRGKCSQRFKTSRLDIGKELIKKVRYEARSLETDYNKKAGII